VTVILPVRREGVAFEDTLRRVLAQDYPQDRMEILVVDGMSDDETRDVGSRLAAQDRRLRLLDNPGRIVPNAMNIGISAAQGSVIVRVDGHTRIAPDYVTRCVEALDASGASCVGGRMDPEGTTPIGRAVAAATSGSFGVGNSHFHFSLEPRFTDSVYLGCWPRRVLVEIGGFDEEMVRDQDDELNYRLRKQGGTVWLDPSIRSWYTPRGSLAKLWKQYYQYGLWKIRVFQKHPAMMRLRHFAPSALVLALAASTLLAVIVRGAWIAPAAILALYLGAAGVASLRSQAGAQERVLLPLVFGVLHAAYGTGFLVGAFKFFRFWFRPEAGRLGLTRLATAGPEEKDR
jgi:cellulose synthase/poly-beta-1,6-N-acetylglucosamine synthase-like glycosyltransferase